MKKRPVGPSSSSVASRTWRQRGVLPGHLGQRTDTAGDVDDPRQRLGVTLFERTSRRVELTDAGSVLLNEARRR
ncbi:LysR family transcriptional regulator [Actinosynnema sp. ALI-1.44]|uniref:LysR family transcriptional regulator n=1 Tax=Actinosynnema sp. ALI-1.44 TaxID=1933779 RepID=UPI00143DD67B|nr:LysR family transcriptional regulator [Actinosynnema sp. ALI-1.44]